MPRTPRTQHPRTSVTDADIQAHEPLVYLVLRRMYRTGQIAQWVEHDDLMQAGRIGLWKALKRYDPAAGRFSTFAIPTVWGEMMRYQRDTGPQHGWHRAHGQVAQIDSLHRETDRPARSGTPWSHWTTRSRQRSTAPVSRRCIASPGASSRRSVSPRSAS
jgi:RNA polymerase sigma factor (sigma-70 family)